MTSSLERECGQGSLTSLATRVEEASEDQQREMLIEAYQAVLEGRLGRDPEALALLDRLEAFLDAEAYLDAAMQLLPGPDWEWSLEWESGSLLYHPDCEQYARVKIGDPTLRMEAECVTPALALTAACLKAISK